MGDTIEARVARGAALLDKAQPGWEWKIAPDRLAMASCNECILGQIYGDYDSGFVTLVSRMPRTMNFRSASCGFTIPDADQLEATPEVFARFDHLADAWRALIRSRLNTPAESTA